MTRKRIVFILEVNIVIEIKPIYGRNSKMFPIKVELDGPDTQDTLVDVRHIREFSRIKDSELSHGKTKS